MARDSASTFARELARGATIIGPDGRDVTSVVRAEFRRTLPACGGDRAAAAARAVASALAGQQREEA